MSKNSIRYSNQRCVVVHGTHNVTVIENVAHENKGHCYMLEDGGELDNKFIRNLGASTRAAKRVVRSLETDNSGPSTFWISNPANSWTGNVAAGSAGNGFWFELRLEVRPPTSLMALSTGMVPRTLPLKLFLNNVAHSNTIVGLRKFLLSVGVCVAKMSSHLFISKQGLILSVSLPRSKLFSTILGPTRTGGQGYFSITAKA